MSWKNVKDHYRIGHIVQVREGKICIGSPYVSNLIMVSFEGEVAWGTLGPSNNDDLARYHAEFTADPVKLRELIEAPDTFERSLPVFTYEGGEILEKQCEQYDWPNVTHDGFLMYENMFSADRSKVIEWAKSNAASGVELAEGRIEEIRKNLAEVEAWRAERHIDDAISEARRDMNIDRSQRNLDCVDMALRASCALENLKGCVHYLTREGLPAGNAKLTHDAP